MILPAQLERDLSTILSHVRQYPAITKAVRLIIKKTAQQIRKDAKNPNTKK